MNPIFYLILIFILLVYIDQIAFIIYENYSDNINYSDNTNNIITLNNWLNNNNYLNIFKYIFKNINYNINIDSNFDTLNIDDNANNTLYIQYSGESYYNNPNDYYINFIPKKSENNIILFPYGYLHLLYMNFDINYLINNRSYNNRSNNNVKDKFCLFIVSNGSCQERNDFFHKLSKYKKVESYGRYLNNMNSTLDMGFASDEYINKIKEYKFMICFENKSSEYYLTEKLINAYYGETIPIYWGCPQTNKWINTDSILYINPEYNNEQVDNIINEIKLLDNDDNLYQQKFNQSFFKNNQQPDEFNIDKIKEKVELLINNKK